ncbi:MAG: cytochrome c biogenesis protein CcdA [Clostridia bacterium]|jgi:cytochrome c-type biogenesis protein|nr:cytochrome c biogenesis protein CcdA [Clostridia bacterium]
MEYIMSFIEGVVTFISPCLLPMLPIYISYFAGQNKDETTNKYVIKNALGFILGFTIVFILLGAFASSIGVFIKKYNQILNIIFGIIVILFGLNFMELIKIPFINKTKKININIENKGFLSSILFGIIFSVGWTPCIGTFLGSALMLATVKAHVLEGILMLLCFSIGLGIPFFISALLIDKLKTTFDFIKRNYKVINRISGGFLVIIGLLMITGLMQYFLSLVTF